MKMNMKSNLLRRPAVGLLLLLAAVAVPGCDSPTSQVGSSIPLGRYWREDIGSGSGPQTRHARAFTLTSETLASIADTFATMRAGSWQVDSTWRTQLYFTLAAGNYRRATEIRSTAAAGDTNVHYWYFFKRNDSLSYYTGDLLPGSNAGLVGTWSSDPGDTVLGRRAYALTFTADSMTLAGRHPLMNPGTYPYRAERNILYIDGLPAPLGPRYDLIPGFALLVTSSGADGYVKLQ
ncbi:MAG TPA: hypothetical protein VHI13_04280 [Candidatus Kapabacteria bacterium]|nr:hypothetical protein [Candidatus Kapabacteria bacterium]